MNDKMTKSERVEITQLIRKRERVMKKLASERAAQMVAEFEEKSAAIYSFDQDEVWAKAVEEAQKVVDQANKTIAERCLELGIPPEFAPSLSFGWRGRGQNEVASRRAELRRVAASQIKAIEADAVSKIERMSLEAQTAVVAHGLESDAAKNFLDKMPGLEALMPSVDVESVKQLRDKKKQRDGWA